MRILFILKDFSQRKTIRKELAELSEQDSIYFVYNYGQAKDFILKNIIASQLPLDLIITQNNINGLSAIDFYANITKDKSATYSKGDFNFHTIPVVLIVDKDENKNAFLNYGFADVLDNIGLENLYRFNQEFINAVKDWRRHVLDELDNLGIKFNSGKIDPKYLFSKERKRNVDVRILSQNFVLLKRRLDYLWLAANERQIEIAIDKLIKELKRSSHLNKKREEMRYHDLINKYPSLIERDNYSRHWYDARLQKENNEYYKPDYSLLPNFNQQTDLSILEIKLPNEGFIKSTSFHPPLKAGLIHHTTQVNNYKDYLESEQ